MLDLPGEISRLCLSQLPVHSSAGICPSNIHINRFKTLKATICHDPHEFIIRRVKYI